MLSFNKPLNAAQAGNLANFGYFVYWANARGVFAGGGATTPLEAASYNPANLSVTLIPAAVLPLNHLYRITVDGSARPVLGNGLTDAFGGLLEGSSGVTGHALLPDLRRRQPLDLSRRPEQRRDAQVASRRHHDAVPVAERRGRATGADRCRPQPERLDRLGEARARRHGTDHAAPDRRGQRRAHQVQGPAVRRGPARNTSSAR